MKLSQYTADRPPGNGATGALGTLLLWLGLAAAVLLGVLAAHDAVYARVQADAAYLALPAPAAPGLVASSQEAVGPVIRHSPAARRSAPPASPPQEPQTPPLVRLEIPAIALDSPVVETHPRIRMNDRGEKYWEWEVAEYAVGHQNLSGAPGEGENIVLAGHNNTKGQVFRALPQVSLGDEVVVHTTRGAFPYVVTERTIVPYRADPAKGDAVLQEYAGRTGDERLTLISCYPYVTNADRIVVVAKPLDPPAPAAPGEEERVLVRPQEGPDDGS